MAVIKPRRPVAALAMSAVLPGFGQLYNGEVNKAIWLFLVFILLNVPLLGLVMYASGVLLVPLLVLTLIAGLAIWIYGMRDAWRQARAQSDYEPASWQVNGLYPLVFIVCNLIALPFMTLYVRGHLVEPFRIPSASMVPSLLPGDFLTADKRYNCPSCKDRITRGDVAVFVNPDDRTTLFIKRIVALPGDRVQISGREVRINGRPLAATDPDGASGEFTERSNEGREWRVRWDASAPTAAAVDLTVPAGAVYLLGDNRSNSLDSRHFGTVPMRDVVGRARQIWFSLGPDGIRFSRLGRRIE